MGIWLLDGSVHAIFRRRGERLPDEIQCSLHQQWLGGYGRCVLDSCEGAKIWVIGGKVFKLLSGFPDWHSQGWVYQPNAANYPQTESSFDLDRNWPRLLEDCWSLRQGLQE
jgi:hypothetical protein